MFPKRYQRWIAVGALAAVAVTNYWRLFAAHWTAAKISGAAAGTVVAVAATVCWFLLVEHRRRWAATPALVTGCFLFIALLVSAPHRDGYVPPSATAGAAAVVAYVATACVGTALVLLRNRPGRPSGRLPGNWNTDH